MITKITPLSIDARIVVVHVTLPEHGYWLTVMVGPDGHHTLACNTHDSLSFGVYGMTQNFVDAARDAWTHWVRDVTPP